MHYRIIILNQIHEYAYNWCEHNKKNICDSYLEYVHAT